MVISGRLIVHAPVVVIWADSVLCRAGFNLLDGYGGGSELAANFGFAMVRETSDHGFFNSWVRPRLHA